MIADAKVKQNTIPADGEQLDYRHLFESAPCPFLFLLPNFTIIAVSDSYTDVTITKRGEIVGRNLFQVFPSNPNNPSGNGLKNLAASFGNVLKNKSADIMDAQKYDIRKPDGTFEVRYWKVINSPVLDDKGEVKYIFNKLEDVTEQELGKDKNGALELAASIQNKMSEQLLQYKYFFDNSIDLAVIANIEGYFEITNPQFINVLGYSEKELRENKFVSFIHPDDAASALNIIEKLKEGAASINFVNRFRTKNGNYLWFEWTANSNKVVGKLYAVGRDITDRKKSEASLLESEKMLEEAEHLAHIGSWVWDIKKDETIWSEELYAIAGIDSKLSSPNYFNLSAIYTEESWKLLEQAVNKTISDATPYELQLEMVHKDGQIRNTNTKGFGIKGSTGQIVRLFGTVQDITERMRAEEKLHESEIRFRTLYESSFDAIMTLEPPFWKFTSGNSTAVKMFLAKDVKEFTSKDPWQFSPEKQPDDKFSVDMAKYEIDRAMKHGSSFFEWVHMRMNGETFPATVLLTRVEISGRKFLQATVRDITASKKAEERLLESERFLIEVQRIVNLGTYSMDIISGKWTSSEVLDNIFGIGSDYDKSVEGWSAIINPEWREIITDYFAKEVIGRKTKFDKEYKIIRQNDNAERWVHGIGSLKFNAENQPITMLGAIRDITETKKTEADLILKSEELARANAELEQFAYVSSHDLQEPLRTISNFAGLLEGKYAGKSDGNSDQYLKLIVNATTRMQNLIRDLLDLSRIGRNITFTKVDCNELLVEVIAEMDASIKESNAKIIYSILPILTGNKSGLKQLFLNLISNSIKFRNKNAALEIGINAAEKNNEYLFAFKDNGIGIEEKYFNKLFVIFQRLNNAAEYPGTGIGLAICKKIVTQHKGKIWVESKLNEGSTFYFTISKKI